MPTESFLYKNISLCTFSVGTVTLTEVVGIQVDEASQEISSTADAATEQQLVDAVNMTTTVTVFSKNLAQFGLLAQGAAAGTLVANIKSADGGDGKILTFSGCRFMGDEANPKHASVECAVALHFECQSTADAEPLAVTALA